MKKKTRVNLFESDSSFYKQVDKTQYNHNPDQCPIDGEKMSKGFILGRSEEVYWCPIHRITLPIPVKGETSVSF